MCLLTPLSGKSRLGLVWGVWMQRNPLSLPVFPYLSRRPFCSCSLGWVPYVYSGEDVMDLNLKSTAQKRREKTADIFG
jgi:hypothetical protein